jgi:hypothetical protein
MKRKLVFLLVLLGISGLVVGLIKLLNDRSPKQGVLKISSNPATSIFLDNKHLGRTPFEDKIMEGEYTVKLVPETSVQPYSSWQGKIRVSQNLLTYVNAELTESEFSSATDILWLEKITSKQSELSVITNPDGASVSVNGETKGISPLLLSDLPAGDHSVVVTSPGFVTRTIKVKTTSGYKLIANLKLPLSSLASAPSESEATPSAGLDEDKEITPTTSPGPSGAPTGSPSPKVTQADPPKPYAVIKETPVGFLRVRMEPTTSSSEAARVNPGEKYSILDTSNGWYRINYTGKEEGWISGQYAEKIE